MLVDVETSLFELLLVGYLNDVPLTVATDMMYVVKALRKANSGLDVKTRMWLKITIPNAFIGEWNLFKVILRSLLIFDGSYRNKFLS